MATDTTTESGSVAYEKDMPVGDISLASLAELPDRLPIPNCLLSKWDFKKRDIVIIYNNLPRDNPDRRDVYKKYLKAIDDCDAEKYSEEREISEKPTEFIPEQ